MTHFVTRPTTLLPARRRPALTDAETKRRRDAYFVHRAEASYHDADFPVRACECCGGLIRGRVCIAPWPALSRMRIDLAGLAAECPGSNSS